MQRFERWWMKRVPLRVWWLLAAVCDFFFWGEIHGWLRWPVLGFGAFMLWPLGGEEISSECRETEG